MNKSSSMFGQPLEILLEKEFSRVVKASRAEAGAKGLSSLNQFVMPFCQSGQSHSLR